jgi:hypothetical protein
MVIMVRMGQVLSWQNKPLLPSYATSRAGSGAEDASGDVYVRLSALYGRGVPWMAMSPKGAENRLGEPSGD